MGRTERLVAIDTETTLFTPAEFAAGRKTCVKPQSIPDLVLASIAEETEPGGGIVTKVLHRSAEVGLLCKLREHLRDPSVRVVFHNAPFDIGVLLRWAALQGAVGSLKADIAAAVDAGRVSDTRTFELLLRIAKGSNVDHLDTTGLKLSDLAYQYCGIELDKESGVRTDFARYFDSMDGMTDTHRDYAIADAVATLKVHKKQRAKAEVLIKQESRYPVLPDAREKFGLLAERIHVAGDIAFNWLSNFPVHIDLDEAKTRADLIRKEKRKLEDALVVYKYGRRGPKTGRFAVSLKRVREVLKDFALKENIQPDYSDTGLLTTSDRFWAEHIRKPTEAELESPNGLTDPEARLAVWMRFMRLRKLLALVEVYATSPRHYPRYRAIGARTTRTACSKPNLQQVPKRRDGIRSIFIPRPGYEFVEIDWSAAELRALAQVQLLMYDRSPLAYAFKEDLDPHAEAAKRMFAEEWEAGDDAKKKELRQACKAVNFGLPGGMGAPKFAKFARQYGFYFTVDQARELRRQALNADPILKEYLRDGLRDDEDAVYLAAKNLGLRVDHLIDMVNAWRSREDGTVFWRLAIKRLRAWSRGDTEYKIRRPAGLKRGDLWRQPSHGLSGMVRGRSNFTEAHNFPFQNAVADAMKLALWRFWKAHGGDYWYPVASVHDSVLVEIRKDLPEGHKKELRTWFAREMIYALDEITPDVEAAVEVEECGDRWGASTGVAGKNLEKTAEKA